MSAKKAKKAAAKKAPKTTKPKEPSKLATLLASKIKLDKKKMPENPGRPGSKAFKYRELYAKFNGKTVAELRDGGGHLGYLHGDIKRGYITLEAPKKSAA